MRHPLDRDPLHILALGLRAVAAELAWTRSCNALYRAGQHGDYDAAAHQETIEAIALDDTLRALGLLPESPPSPPGKTDR